MEMSNELPMANGQDREKVCVIGASGKLGRYMVQHALDKGYEVVGVCRPQSVEKLADFADRIEIVAGATDDGAPGVRPEYRDTYYGAFVLDPDGHKLEAVHAPRD